MALRNILREGDSALGKKCRAVKDFNKRLHLLLDDMRDTLENACGAGLAAPQVGVLRRAALVLETNVDEEQGQQPYVIEMINPEIVFSEGTSEEPEGCLSIPGVFALVSRPSSVRVRAQDRDGNFFEVCGEGMTARAFCHEIDHLDGRLFTELAAKLMTPEELDAYYEAKHNAKAKEELN